MRRNSPEFRIPLNLEVWGGRNQYSVKIIWPFDTCVLSPSQGMPSADQIVAVMTSLGKKADGVKISKIGINSLEVSSGRLYSLRKTVTAIIKESEPANWAPGDSYMALYPEVIFPPVVNS